MRAVEADLHFVAPDSLVNRRFVAPGEEVNTGRFEKHRVQVRDARPIREQFDLDTHGFVLADHSSAVADFFDSEQVEAVYPNESERVVRELTGADRVISTGWMIRTSGDRSDRQRKVLGYTHRGGIQPPATDVHVDSTPDRAERTAERVFRESFPDEAPFKRFISSSLWRAFSPPPQDWPLAVCDGRTVGMDEGTPNELFIVDEIPDRETMLGDLSDGDEVITASIFRYNPEHQWWYFSNMSRDEVLLFKFHDSDPDNACRVPHAAFHDPSYPNANPRASIEFRTFAFFL